VTSAEHRRQFDLSVHAGRLDRRRLDAHGLFGRHDRAVRGRKPVGDRFDISGPLRHDCAGRRREPVGGRFDVHGQFDHAQRDGDTCLPTARRSRPLRAARSGCPPEETCRRPLRHSSPPPARLRWPPAGACRRAVRRSRAILITLNATGSLFAGGSTLTAAGGVIALTSGAAVDVSTATISAGSITIGFEWRLAGRGREHVGVGGVIALSSAWSAPGDMDVSLATLFTGNTGTVTLGAGSSGSGGINAAGSANHRAPWFHWPRRAT